MNDQIFETVVTTVDSAGRPHVAPMGVRYQGRHVVLMPFRPSTTLDNVLATRHAVVNLVTDTRVFAGCVTGRRDWPLVRAERIAGVRLAAALGHVELSLDEAGDDPTRPVLRMARVHELQHAPFVGFNRAQAAVIEGAVLVSRLRMLAPDKVDSELRYLQIAIDKTAGAQEHEAWGWLREAVATHRARPVAPGAQVPAEPRTQVPAEPATQVPAEPRTQVPAEPRAQLPAEPRTQVPGEPAMQVSAGPGAPVPAAQSAPSDSGTAPR